MCDETKEKSPPLQDLRMGGTHKFSIFLSSNHSHGARPFWMLFDAVDESNRA